MTKNTIPREEAKTVILAMSHGGTGGYNKLTEKPQWLTDLKETFVDIGEAMASKYKDEKLYIQKLKPKVYSIWGSLVSRMIQDVENDVIQCLDSYLTDQDYSVDTLIFDGVLVRNNKQLHQVDLDKASTHIEKETGYKVKLLIKEFDQTLKVPDNLLTDDEEYAVIKKEFEQTVCKILNPLKYLVRANDGRLVFKTRQDLKDTYENYNSWKGTTTTGGKAPKSFIENWLKDPANLSFDTIDFLPKPLHCPSTTYNTFNGFEVEKIEGAKCNQDTVDTIRAHTRYLVGDSDENNAYFEAFFANVIQEPANLSKVAIILKSREGCGKNLFLELIEAIMGKEYYVTTTSPKDKLFGKFNSNKLNKLLINLDEANAKDSRDYYEIIKAEITNPTTEIERKGHDSFIVRNFARYMFTTNNELPIKISKSDRRFALFECAGKRKDKAYYDKLKAFLTDDEALFSYYTYLKSIDLTKYDFVANRPKTPFYLRSVKQCEENVYEFLQQIVLDDTVVDNELIRLKGDTYIYRASQFYKDYVQFCIDHKYLNRLSNASFSNTMEMVISKSRDNKGKLYKFEKHNIKQYLETNDYWEEPEECLID